MKRRSGFVSNSSSSSFIVGFERRPSSVEEVHKMLFKDDLNDNTHVTYYDYSISTKQVAERVFSDLKEQKRSADSKKIEETVKSGWFEGHPSLSRYSHRNEKLDEMTDEFRRKFPDLHYYGEDKYLDNKEAVKLAKEIQEAQRKQWDEERRIVDEAAERYTKKDVLPLFKNKKVYVFSYADDGGEAALEHGNIFGNLPHIRISHH